MTDNKNDIPKYWQIKKLREVCIYTKGKKPSLLDSVKTKDCSIPYINIKAFEKGIYDEYTNGIKCNLCEDGDLLMVWDGARCGFIGKAKNGAVGSTLMKILPTDELDKEYLYHFIDSKFHIINTNPKGVGIPHVEPNLLWNFYIPIPPLSEQKAIVEKIEELFSELDKGIEELRTAQDQLKVYRQSLLKWAFEGKLTMNWRAENPYKMDSLLKQLKKDKENAIKEKRISKGEYFPNFEEKDLILVPPLNWLCLPWKTITSNSKYAMKRGPFGSALKKDFFVDSGYVVYEQGHAINDDPYRHRYFITEEKFQELKAFEVKSGDMIISCSGVTLGRICLLPEDAKTGIINQALLKIDLNDQIMLKKYFILLFRSEVFQHLIFEKSLGTAMPNMVSMIELKEIPIPIPSLSEQQKIVEILEEKLSVCDQMEQTITQSLQQAESLRQSILKQAFGGKLITVQEETPAYVPKKIPFYQAQLFGYIIDTSTKNNIDHGEMTLAKNAYLLDKIYGVPTYFNYQRWHLGPYPPEMKGVLNGGSLKQFFSRVDYHIELQNSEKLFKYTNPYELQVREAMDDLSSIISQYEDKERSYQTELLATVCKVIEDIQTTDLKAVRASMKEWKIDLKTTKHKNKAEKFSESDTASCLNFIISKGWDKKLIN